VGVLVSFFRSPLAIRVLKFLKECWSNVEGSGQTLGYGSFEVDSLPLSISPRRMQLLSFKHGVSARHITRVNLRPILL
jgi:hypothetical protein